MPYSVCIFEDNDNLRESVCSLLSIHTDFIIKGAYSNCLDIERIIRQQMPDVLLMDIDLPGINGIEAVKRVRSFNRDVQIIMLTIFDDDEHVFTALKSGANGYLLKKNITDRLVIAIQEVMDGGAPMSPAIARMVIAGMHTPAEKSTVNNYQLTTREKEILSLLSKGNSHKMIAADFNISIETVRTHLKNIYQKLQVHSQTEVLSKVFNEKLV